MSHYARISPEDALHKILHGNASVIDIRDATSFAMGRIEGSARVEVKQITDYIAAVDKSSTVIVCCYHGNSSQGVGEFLAEQGIAEVYSLDGGFAQWHALFPDDCESD